MSQLSSRTSSQNYTLQTPLTPIFGRGAEVERVVELLADPNCRLLTVVGPGGVGKTRLAIEAAVKAAAGFTHGVYLVSLQTVRSLEKLIATLADALNFPLTGRQEPRTQLLSHLRSKEVLLVLDNLEQLLPSAGPSQEPNDQNALIFLTELLKTAPAVKLLATSREALRLHEEWLYPIRGLSYPNDDRERNIAGYGAVRLFVERAHQVQPDFSLEEAPTAVARICRLVEGLPLAIEIAASWTKTVRCTDIAEEIENNLQFLTTRLRDVPERHKTMQAVFDQSWKRLTETEQKVFKHLSVFRDSFGRSAAKQIAGATLPVLSALVDKSLLRWEPEKQYEMHELLRQYAAEQLQESPEAVTEIRRRHGAYYANFLHERLNDLLGGRQKEAVIEIELELDNIRLAWEWAVDDANVEQIQKAAQTLSLFYQFQGRYLEGARAFETATQSLENCRPTERIALTLVLVLVDRAWFYIRLGWLDQAEAVSIWCRELYHQLDRPPVPGHGTDPFLPLGIIASIHGDHIEAARLGENVRRVSEAHNHLWNRQFAYYLLTRAALAQGEYEAAQRYAQQTFAITEETQDHWFMAYCHNELGNVAQALGNFKEARGHYDASYAIGQEFDDPEIMAAALNYLGKIALRQHDTTTAKQHYRQSLKIYKNVNDEGGSAASLAGLGHVAFITGDYQTAQQHFYQALQKASDINFVPLLLSILAGTGELLMQTGNKERGLELLALTLHHPAGDSETKAIAKQGLARYEAELPSNVFAEATQRGRSGDLETVAVTLQAELAGPLLSPVAIEAAATDRPSHQAQPLIESLTPRELEVLRLIAEGHTNQEIADELFVVVGTVKAHASNIYGKLDVNNRTEAVVKAKALNLLTET